jgi:hypothetical protein
MGSVALITCFFLPNVDNTWLKTGSIHFFRSTCSVRDPPASGFVYPMGKAGSTRIRP